MKRYEAIKEIVQLLAPDAGELIIASTGMISRELHSLKDAPANFYMLGSMGLASSIGLGLAVSLPDRQVVIIEGDGSLLMNMGSMATIGYLSPSNLVHIVLDNEAHDSTGGQATASRTTRLDRVARDSGYRLIRRVTSKQGLRKAFRDLPKPGPIFVLVKIGKGSISGLARVSYTPEKIKNRFKRSI